MLRQSLKTFVFSAVASLSIVAFSTSASATTLTYGGQHNGRATVKTTNSSALPNVNASAGTFTMNNTSSGGSFMAWCLDLYSYLANGEYTELNGPFTGPNTGSNPNPFYGSNGPILTNQQLANIEDLFETNANAVETSLSLGNTGANNIQSAGFQLALWELIYETSGSLGLTTGVLQGNQLNSGGGTNATRAAINSAADAFLGNLGGAIQQEYHLTFWQHNSGTNQNLVSIAAVPVPAAGFLLLAGLAGFGVASRRRKIKG